MILINTLHRTWVATRIPDSEAYGRLLAKAYCGDRAAEKRLERIYAKLCPLYESGCICGNVRGPSSPAGYKGTGQDWLDLF